MIEKKIWEYIWKIKFFKPAVSTYNKPIETFC